MKNSYILRTKKIVRGMALFHNFANLFTVRLNIKQLDSHASFFI